MPAVRVLVGPVSEVRQHIPVHGPVGLLMAGVTFRIGTPPELVTIGGFPAALLEGEYLAVAVKPGRFSDRGSVALAYRRLGQKADAEPAGGFSGYFCLTAAIALAYLSAQSLRSPAQPILAAVSAAIAALLFLTAMHRRRLARVAAQALAQLSLDSPPPPQPHHQSKSTYPCHAEASDLDSPAKSAGVGRWLILAAYSLLVLLVAVPFALSKDLRTQNAGAAVQLAIIAIIVYAVLIAAYFVPVSDAERQWQSSPQARRSGAALGVLIGALTVGGGIFIAIHGQYHIDYSPRGHGGGLFWSYALTWAWDSLGDYFGPWAPGGLTAIAGIAVCIVSIQDLRRG
jgi:hypothetical protein